MKKLALAALVGSLSFAAHATTCLYPLDATAGQYAAAGITPFPAINLQSVSYTAQSTQDPVSGGLQITNYQAASYNGAAAALQSAGTGLPGGDVALPASGIVGIEMAVDNFPATQSAGANLYLSFGVGTSNGANSAADPTQPGFAVNVVMVDSGNGAGSFVTVAAGNTLSGGTTNYAAAAQTPLTLPLPASYHLGIYLNMSTREVGVTVNGTDLGYLQNTQGGPFLIPAGVSSAMLAMNGIMQVQADNPLIGSTVGGTLITDSSQFTQPFPAGTVDICGNSIPTTGGGGNHGKKCGRGDHGDDNHGRVHGDDNHH
jgi:hypothetical protein